MITLNLIPESIREENKLKHVYVLNVHLGTLSIYLSVIIASLIIILRLVLNHGYVNAQEQLAVIDSNNAPYNKKIREINKKINIVSQAVGQTHSWDKLIIDFGNIIPHGVTLTYLKIDLKSESLIFSGVADTRDNLLKLKSIIGDSTYIQPVEIPLSSLMEKENIRFSFTTKINIAKHDELTMTKNASN